jgi:RND family efflux transporter MFP subunit
MVGLSPERRQLVGVRSEEVTRRHLDRTIRTVGRVAMDERRLHHVHTKYEAYVEKLYVGFVGQMVRKGDRLAALYSPELVATQQEYLLARRNVALLKDAGPALVAAARARLERFDLSPDQIRKVEESGEPLRTVTLYAPVSGTVMARNAFPKQRVTPGTELYSLAGLDSVWILADVFQSDAPLVREGTPARVTTPYGPAGAIAARVDFIQPGVDPQTRTLKVRLNAANPGLRLLPDMFVDIEFRAPRARRLTVPSGAIIDAGLRKTVFVDRGNGYLEPRQVETGPQHGGRTEIQRGLKGGERIVASGTFLIDSEAQLKAAAGAFEKSADGKSADGKTNDQPHH